MQVARLFTFLNLSDGRVPTISYSSPPYNPNSSLSSLFSDENSLIRSAMGILSTRKSALLLVASRYSEIARPAVESIDEEAYFPSAVPTLGPGFGIITEEVERAAL